MSSRARRWMVSALAVVCVGAVASSVALWRENGRLRRQVAQPGMATGGRAARSPLPLAAGRMVPPFVARSTEGKEIEVARRGRGKTLLFIFEPGCGRCEASIPSWTEIYDRLTASQTLIQVVALSTGDSYSTVGHARARGLPFAVVTFPDDRLKASYGVTRVPMTVVVNGAGTVEQVWNEPLTRADIADVLESASPIERIAR